MAKKKITRRDKSYELVYHIFKHEQDIRLAIVEAKTANRKDMCGGGGSAFVSDPTAGKTIRLMSTVPAVRLDGWTVHRPEDWLMVIALTYANTDELERKVVRKYYDGYSMAEQGNRASPDYSGYAESTLYAVLNRFQNLAVEIACQFGLIRVVDV